MALLTHVTARQVLRHTIIFRPSSTCRSLSTEARRNNDINQQLLHRTHLLFGANTDVGKSIISTGLVHAAAAATSSSSTATSVNYIKPLQCGGSDESFVLSHCNNNDDDLQQIKDINCQTLVRWETPASPHLVSRWENQPVSDDEVLLSLQSTLQNIENDYTTDESYSASTSRNSSDDELRSITIIETAGGVLSPSSSSPLNKSSTEKYWGWSTQADLYSSLNIPIVFVGDGKLGGISVTLASLEALWSRGYRIDAVVFIESADSCYDDGGSDIQFGKGNAEALREYISMQKQQLHNQHVSTNNNNTDRSRNSSACLDDDSIICLPPLPPMPIPLDDWYACNQDSFLHLHHLLSQQWRDKIAL